MVDNRSAELDVAGSSPAFSKNVSTEPVVVNVVLSVSAHQTNPSGKVLLRTNGTRFTDLLLQSKSHLI